MPRNTHTPRVPRASFAEALTGSRSCKGPPTATHAHPAQPPSATQAVPTGRASRAVGFPGSQMPAALHSRCKSGCRLGSRREHPHLVLTAPPQLFPVQVCLDLNCLPPVPHRCPHRPSLRGSLSRPTFASLAKFLHRIVTTTTVSTGICPLPPSAPCCSRWLQGDHHRHQRTRKLGSGKVLSSCWKQPVCMRLLGLPPPVCCSHSAVPTALAWIVPALGLHGCSSMSIALLPQHRRRCSCLHCFTAWVRQHKLSSRQHR